MAKIEKGKWVEIRQVILQPEERAQSLPEETKRYLTLCGFQDFDRRY